MHVDNWKMVGPNLADLKNNKQIISYCTLYKFYSNTAVTTHSVK